VLAQITSRNREDAADAQRDAVLSAHRSAPIIRHDSAVSSWQYRIVVNACLDRLRRNKTHPNTALEDDACHVGDPTPRVDTAMVVAAEAAWWWRRRPRACSALPRAL
jgi:RNA polymerase sigma-70 factor (ECF subfamily)